MIKRFKILFTLLVLILTQASGQNSKTDLALKSPDGNLRFIIHFSNDEKLFYSFYADDKQLMGESLLGLENVATKRVKAERRNVNKTWEPVWGKRAIVPDQYNELSLNLKSYWLTVRLYNNGAAFKYTLPNDEVGLKELTQFNFSGDYTAWFYNGENPNSGPNKLSEVDGKRLPVMTIKADEYHYMAIHEADLVSGYPLVLENHKGQTTFSVASKQNTAWRVIMYGRTPGDLIDSHLIELLNPAPEKGMDFSWVKPGVAVWDWRINGAVVNDFKYDMSLPSWKKMVDFAASNGFGYLVLDADWYGPEFGKESDPVKGGKVEQVHEIIKYGKAKNVGVWLYLNDVGGRNFPIEQTLKQYSDWGTAGIKYGFMQGSPEEKNAWTKKITQLCAQYHLLCDFHDGPVHPYGQMRTWPNALTREYCHSQLDAHRVFQPSTFVTSVFVNMLAGPIDMCNGLADLTQVGRVDEPSPVPSTLAGEAARTLIVFSGATIIPDIPENYLKHPEILQFIRSEKMPWKESKTLLSEIGEYIVMARQNAEGNWLVGAATNEESRELNIPLHFLSKKLYNATIIEDGENSDYRTHKESYKVSSKIVGKNDIIQVKLVPGGGACILIELKK